MKSIKKTICKYHFSYWHAFLIPLLVMLAGCIGSGIFPFGNQSFLRNDLYNQYMPFFQALHDSFWKGGGLSYSMQLGLGSGFAALYGYYLASPINWLVVLCPRPFIAEFITILILIKMSLAGVTGAYYLRQKYRRADFILLAFSSAYALSGFMAAYQWNIMWLDVILLAPLVILALEELVDRGRGLRYCLLLAVSIYTNFYLSIMLCIFLVLYYTVLILWKPWKEKLVRSLQFGFYSLLAGGMAGAMLLPVYFALSGTEFHQFNFPDTVKWYMNFLELINRHCMNVSMKIQADHWPNIYCGVAMYLLLPLFVCNKRISWKDKVSRLLLVGFFWLSFSCNVLDFIWHGMNYPDSLPGRQGYLYVWLLLVIGYQVYINLRGIRLWHMIISAVLGYGIIISGWIFTDVQGTNGFSYGISLVFITLYIALLLAFHAWRFPRVRAFVRRSKWKGLVTDRCLVTKLVVLCIVIVELSCNMYVTSIRTVNRTKYMAHFNQMEKAVDRMKQEDAGLYRTEIFGRLTKNDSMMWGINTATVFSSTANANVVELYKSLGLGTTRVSYWYQGATPLVSALLGVKYMVGYDDAMENSLYDLIYSDETGYLYACKYSLPMGYVIDPEVEAWWDLKYYNPVNAQNELCRLLGTSGDLLVPIDSTKAEDGTYTISLTEDAYVYVYLGRNSLSEVKAQIGERTEHFGQVSFDYLLDLSLIKAGEEAVLSVVKEDQKFQTFQAYKLDETVLQEAVDILGRNTLEITDHGADYLEGTIRMDKAGKLVIPIPQEKGWTLYVNGEERETESFKDTFLAVTLEPGAYDIALEYETPGMKTGMLLSAGSIAVFALLVWYSKRKRKYIA